MKTYGRLIRCKTPGKGRFTLCDPKGSKPLPTQQEVLALLRNQPAIVKKSWNEQDHPRGQPDNKGKFTAGEGGGKGRLQKIEAMDHPEPQADTWAERDERRWDQRDALGEAEELSQAILGYPSTDAILKATEGIAKIHGDLKNEFSTADELSKRVHQLMDARLAWHSDVLDSLKYSGANDIELGKLQKLQTKNDAAVNKVADAYTAMGGKLEEAIAAVTELAEAEPDVDAEAPGLPTEPTEPEEIERHQPRDVPDEPSLADSEAHAAWQREVESIQVQNAKAEELAEDAQVKFENEHAAWEAQCEQIQEQYDAKVEKEHAKWEKQMESAQGKVDVAEEKFDGASEDFELAVSESDERVQELVSSLSEKIGGRIDNEEAADEEPEENTRKDFCHKPEVSRIGLQTKEFEESKHPRGGDKEHPGRFSQGSGGGAGKLQAKPKEGTATDASPPKGGDKTEAPSDDEISDSEIDRLEAEQSGMRDVMAEADRVSEMAAKRYATVDELASNNVKVIPKLSDTANQYLYHLDYADGSKAIGKTGEFENHSEEEYGVPKGQAYVREAVASQVAEIFGFTDLVPPTIKRDIPGFGEGSVQAWVPSSESGKPKVAAALGDDVKFDGPEDLARAALFDFLMGTRDRHEKNWMLSGGKLALIDNGLSLPEGNQSGQHIGSIRSGLFTAAYEQDLPIPKMDAGTIEKAVSVMKENKINDKAISAFQERATMLQQAAKGGGATFRHLPVARNEAKKSTDWEFST